MTCTPLVRGAWSLALVAALSSWTAPASAQDTAAAARAFQTAQKAELGEDWSRAAEFYELADSLVPSPEALRSALRSRMEAGETAIAAGHAELLLERYPTDETSRDLAESTLEQVRGSLVEVRVSCGATKCRVLADEAAVGLDKATDHVFFLEPGRHLITAEYPNGTTKPQTVDEAAGSETALTFASPPPPKPKPGDAGGGPVTIVVDDDMQGISPWYVGIGAAATTGFGIGSIVSGLQANEAGDDFDNLGRTRELYDDANRLEIQTNVLVGVTAGLGATTVLLAIFTDWDGTPEDPLPDDELSLRLAPGPGDLGLSTELRF